MNEYIVYSKTERELKDLLNLINTFKNNLSLQGGKPNDKTIQS